jgi:hypothetical protein
MSLQRLTRIVLVFEETATERTPEFVLRWSGDGGRSFREIRRQQSNFSADTAREVEEYQVDLSGAKVLELVIVPDISRGSARALRSRGCGSLDSEPRPMVTLAANRRHDEMLGRSPWFRLW